MSSKLQQSDLSSKLPPGIFTTLAEERAFTYSEVFKYKFLFWCVKKSERFKNYQALTKVIRERMDAQSIMSNSAKVSVLSSTLLKPYQMTLIQESQRSNLEMDLSSKSMSLNDALHQFNSTDAGNSTDILSTKIDKFIEDLLVQQDDDLSKGAKASHGPLKSLQGGNAKIGKNASESQVVMLGRGDGQ